MSKIKTSCIAVAMGCSFSTGIAFAIPLQGLFTIEPGVQSQTGYYYDPPGTAPPYYYVTGKTYTSGSVFVMNGGTDVLVDPATGRLKTTKVVFDVQAKAQPGFAHLLNPGSDGGMVAGTLQSFVTSPNEPHVAGTTGTNCAGASLTFTTSSAGTSYCTAPVSGGGDIIAPFSFFGINTYVGTNPVSYVTGNTKGTPTFDYDPVTGALNVDLSSWAVMWNGSVFEQGPGGTATDGITQYLDIVDASYDPVTKRYSVSWANRIAGGPFNGFQGYWHIEGTHVVPVPAAAWLLGSGLLGLAGLARRRTKSGL